MKQSYDDIIGCIVQSLNDNFADYCFNEKQLSCVISRLRKEGKTSMLYKKFTKDGWFNYWQLIPVNIYKNYNGKDIQLKKLGVSVNNAPDNYRIVYKKGFCGVTIKDYNESINADNLSKVVRITNAENV